MESDSPLTNQIINLIISGVTVRKTKGTLGGWRPGAGRKPRLQDPVSFTCELERADVEFLETIAEERGGVSIGSLVRAAVAAYVKRQRRR
jgi:hypothetical protein